MRKFYRGKIAVTITRMNATPHRNTYLLTSELAEYATLAGVRIYA